MARLNHIVRQPSTHIVAAALVSAAIYAWISRLSLRFDGLDYQGRPILLVVGLFLACFVLYVLAVLAAKKLSNSWHTSAAVLAVGFVFRLILVQSVPIQEIDIYRYLWDGAVVSQGVNPFRYPPQAVLDRANDASRQLGDSSDLDRLANLVRRHGVWREVLARVHFRELSTVYPAASQAVFSLAYTSSPTAASVGTRIAILKVWLVAFDCGTCLCLALLLRIARQPAGLLVLYAWCPLAMKEVANSGHLDAIAIFWTTLAITFTAAARSPLCHRNTNSYNTKSSTTGLGVSPNVVGADAPSAGLRTRLLILASSLALAMGVGSKLYPLVLTPWLMLTWWQLHRWRAIVPCLVFVGAVAAMIWPMFAEKITNASRASRVGAMASPSLPGSPQLPPGMADGNPSGEASAKGGQPLAGPPIPALPSVDVEQPVPTVAVTSGPNDGLSTFLQRWEMNDFLFLLLIENLKVEDGLAPGKVAWFSVVPASWRRQLLRAGVEYGFAERQVPRLLARVVVGSIYLVLVGILVVIRRTAGNRRWLETGFLCIAWLWLLCPTGNPWYWLWAVPLLAVVRNRVWWAMSGLVFVYYLRFWFSYHHAEDPVLGTRYAGVDFFDYVVTWVEFAPWLLALAVSAAVSRRPPCGRVS